LAPWVRGRRGKHDDAFAAIRKAGFVRARIDGEVYDLDNLPELSPRRAHDIEAVVDRVVIRERLDARVAESVNLAVKHGAGTVVLTYLDTSGMGDAADDTGDGDAGKGATTGGSTADRPAPRGKGVWRDRLYSTLYACPRCQISYEELEPRTFSFNSPYDACPTCEGLGYRLASEIATETVADADVAAVADAAEPIAEKRKRAGDEVRAEREGLPPGGEGRAICPDCRGARLRPEARSARVGGRPIHEVTAANVRRAREFFASLTFDEPDRPIAEPILREISNRLVFLEKVGVDYLSLDRATDTLSGGEYQRVRLASGIGSGVVGVCYVLDEPSIGLHPRDNGRLIEALRHLQDQGNTVVVVEHDAAVMRQADWLIDVGPGAGRHGGRIVACGTPDEIAANPDSITGRYLCGAASIAVPTERRRVVKSRAIAIEGVTTNNLKDVSAWFPLGVLTCVTGVSGSGKSSLLGETLAPALARRLGTTGAAGAAQTPGPHSSLRGASQIEKLVEIDQTPIGRTPRSNPATYTGAFDEIRRVFAGTRDARQRGFRSSRFSFNVAGGRCEACRGQGQQKIEMNFLPDLYVPCGECGGARFNRATLQIRYRGRSIADVLDMPVDEAVDFFENHPAIRRLVESLRDVGLGYLPLGQSSTTLSGGEAQRIKLATELGRVESGKTLYLLDEPTTGLHFDDIRRLLDVLARLVDRGNTAIVVEHNLDVLKSADWIIDLGPEGGEGGGQIVAVGTPEEIAAIDHNATGRYLRAALASVR
jgi:excinuclease ABC subunit A